MSIEPVVSFRLNIRGFGQDCQQFFPATADGSLLQVVDGLQSRHLFGKSKHNELIKRYPFIFRQCSYLLVQCFWNSQTQLHLKPSLSK